MTFYDIFNGDADGLCALQQLRLAEPRASRLVTGVKRDIGLLARVDAGRGDELTVLDVSLAVNARDLARALEAGARCHYFDHHAAGRIPRHPALEAHIDTAPDLCTSLIVDRHLQGRHTLWAVVGAFGDNLPAAAAQAAARLDLEEADLHRLRELGEALNYNAYGETIEDLNYDPADLFETLHGFSDPRDFIDGEPVLEVLRTAFMDDLDHVERLRPELATPEAAAWILPDAAWSRRVNGVFANRLAQDAPARAHAVLVPREGGYLVSVRAPLERPHGADQLCAGFATGGGRAGAGGINLLPEADVARFLAAFGQAYAT